MNNSTTAKPLITALIVVSGFLNASAAEREPGKQQSLFDGKTTAGWRSYGKPEFPKRGWVVEDGSLHLLPNGNGGDIITTAQFTDFDLQWEWRIASKANNGIKYLVTESRPGAPGHEYQMVDDATALEPKQQTATFYDVIPTQTKTHVKPPGEWNQSRLVIQGNHVEHWLNGDKVLEYELGSPEVKAAVAKSKFKNAAGFGEKTKGHLMLTDHHGETWFRNIRVRELPASRN
jgi:hypothetical protein